MTDLKTRVEESFGLNLEITGTYEPGLAAVCANGTFVGRDREGIREFRGIPFAKPPVDELRWRKPEPCGEDNRVFQALYNGYTPIQTEWPTESASYYPQSEDCLYLNIWTCADETLKNRPVMVFFHGGSYGWGGTADPLYDGYNFVHNNPDIVVVTAGYRTGLMGFVDFSAVPGGEDFPDAPNLGVLDQIEALRWVQQNISAFGGDSGNVTIWGESAGGGSVSLLPLIEDARGLFKRVIAESGSVALTFSKDECQPFTRMLLKESGAQTMDDLMSLSTERLKEINEKLNAYNNFPQRDGVLIPEDPYASYRGGAADGIDFLMGTNADEANYWVGEMGGVVQYRFGIPVKFENDLKKLDSEGRRRVHAFMKRQHGHSIWRMSEFYDEIMFRLPAIKQAEYVSERGGSVYMYYWKKPSSIRYYGACHAVELAYVFGNVDETIYTGTKADEKLSKEVMDMWAAFARTGDPSTCEHAWLRYDKDNRLTMIISDDCYMDGFVLDDQRRVLSPLLHRMINPSYAELDLNVPFVRRTSAAAIVLAGAAVAGTAYLIYRLIDSNKK